METTSPVAAITGGTRGIGRAIALELARAGWRLVLGYRANAAAAGDTVRAVEAAGGEAHAVRVDLGRSSDITAFFEAIDARHGRLDLLVNNAAVNRRDDAGPIPALFDALFHVNVRAVHECIAHAVERMVSNQPVVEPSHGTAVRGRIVNVSAIPGRTVPPPGMVLYGASKAALDGLTRSLAAHWGPRGILINAVAPGVTETDALEGQSPAVLEDLKNRAVLRRLGRPEDVARLVRFLATDQWMVGQSLNYSGGRLL